MPLTLVRIDDRLIHGQVVLGWTRVIKPDRIITANDRIARSPLERKFYAASVPPQIKVSFLTIGETAADLLNNLFQNESLLLLVESVQDVYTLLKKGVRLDEINVGGLHYREGTEELLPYVFLSGEDRHLLRELVKEGVTLRAQDIPGNNPVVINSLIV